jgi:chromosome segregation ATPase
VETVRKAAEEAHPGKETREVLAHTMKILQTKRSKATREEEDAKEKFQDYTDNILKKKQEARSDLQHKEAQIEEIDADVEFNRDAVDEATSYLKDGAKFLPLLGDPTDCEEREAEWGKRCALRTSELASLSQAMNTLDDESMFDDFFRSSLPRRWLEPNHPALLVPATTLTSISDVQSDIMLLAAKGKNASFASIFKVIQGMAALLTQDVKEPLLQETLCGQSVNQTEDHLRKLSFTVSDLGQVVSQHVKSITMLTAEINEVRAAIARHDDEIVRATSVRRREHEENAETIASINITSSLLRFAREGLREFYQDDMEKVSNESGVILDRILGAYVTQRRKGNDTVAMIDSEISKLTSVMHQVAGKEESDQTEFESLVKESMYKRTLEQQALSDKETEISDLEAVKAKTERKKTQKLEEVKAHSKYLSELQGKHTGFLHSSLCAGLSAKHVDAQGSIADVPQSFAMW